MEESKMRGEEVGGVGKKTKYLTRYSMEGQWLTNGRYEDTYGTIYIA